MERVLRRCEIRPVTVDAATDVAGDVKGATSDVFEGDGIAKNRSGLVRE